MMLTIAFVAAHTASADEDLYAKVRIGELAANPDRFIDQKLIITGMVDDICPAAGCWADVKDPDADNVVRFKVPDGKLIFTAQMIGDKVVAQGVFRKHVLQNEDARRWLSHLSRERGNKPSDADLNYQGTLSVYQLEGAAAELLDSKYSLLPKG
jgi:hypothetical protein